MRPSTSGVAIVPADRGAAAAPSEFDRVKAGGTATLISAGGFLAYFGFIYASVQIRMVRVRSRCGHAARSRADLLDLILAATARAWAFRRWFFWAYEVLYAIGTTGGSPICWGASRWGSSSSPTRSR